MSKKRLVYRLIFLETIKECSRNNNFEPTKYKRVEITNEGGEYLFGNNEAKCEMFNQMFCYKDKIREMLEHSDYENVSDLYKNDSCRQELADLQHRLDVAEKALELLSKSNISNVMEEERQPLIDYIKELAEKELRG